MSTEQLIVGIHRAFDVRREAIMTARKARVTLLCIRRYRQTRLSLIDKRIVRRVADLLEDMGIKHADHVWYRAWSWNCYSPV